MPYNKTQFQNWIVAYSKSDSFTKANQEWYIKPQYTTPWYDNGENYKQEITPFSEDRDYKCICGTAIRYRYKIHNRKTKRRISNIGSCCIKKYLPTCYSHIKVAVQREKRLRRRQEFPYKYCYKCFVPHRINNPNEEIILCRRCEKWDKLTYQQFENLMWKYYRC